MNKSFWKAKEILAFLFFVGTYDDGSGPGYPFGLGGLDLAVFQGHNLTTSLAPLFSERSSDVPPDVNVTWSRYGEYITPPSHGVSWQPFGYSFVASADQVAFTFQGGAYSFSIYTGLDNIALVAVPEPTSWQLALGSGILISLSLVKRRAGAKWSK